MTDHLPAFQALVLEASGHIRAGRLADAAAAYREALKCAPAHPVVLHNLGVLLAKEGGLAEAISCFDAAIASDAGYASAHYNRGAALLDAGRRADAIPSLQRAAALDPSHYQAHEMLAFCFLAEGRRANALDHFAWTYDLRRGENRTGAARQSLTHANRVKLLHDARQFAYLAAARSRPNRFEFMTRGYAALAANFPDSVTALSDDDFELLGEDYNCAITIADSPEVPRAVAPRDDKASLLSAFGPDGSGAAYFDGLLTGEALDALRRHLLESTIWHDFSHIEGYVASYLEDGLACPLVLQIADEIRDSFPELLGEHPLTQAWAFKGVTPHALIDAHADDAAYSINFWVTPTEGNRNIDTGGLRICLEPAPPGWAVADYDGDRARAVQFLEQNRSRVQTIPYRANRATLFRSHLLHCSDMPDFMENFEMTRINITMLFGKP